MSILDSEEDIINNNNEYLIKQFIKENYSTSRLIINRLEDGTYVVDCTSVIVTNKLIKHLTNDLFKWGEVYQFDVSDYAYLRTFKGAPRNCVIFICDGCFRLESLEGAPKHCAKFDCRNCGSLKSLKGAPNCLEPSNISGCTNIESFDDAPLEFMQTLLKQITAYKSRF